MGIRKTILADFVFLGDVALICEITWARLLQSVSSPAKGIWLAEDRTGCANLFGEKK